MNAPRPHRPEGILEWAKVASIIGGALITSGIVLHFIGIDTTVQTRMIEPAMAAISKETSERVDGENALRSESAAQNAAVLARLDEIHNLMTARHGRTDRWTQGSEPRTATGR